MKLGQSAGKLEVLDEFRVRINVKVGNEEHALIERRIRILLQDKPRSWPQWLWRWILGKVLAIQDTRGGI